MIDGFRILYNKAKMVKRVGEDFYEESDEEVYED